MKVWSTTKFRGFKVEDIALVVLWGGHCRCLWLGVEASTVRLRSPLLTVMAPVKVHTAAPIMMSCT